MSNAVVGHVEWVEFARVQRVPTQGEIVHADASWGEAAGGGGVAAVQMASLAGEATLFTALGNDGLGERCRRELEALGVRVQAARREGPTARAFTFTDAQGERTIAVLDELLVPRGDDPLPWPTLSGVGALYFANGDTQALRASRAAKVLVATARALPLLATAGVPLDVLVHSGNDAGEHYQDGDLKPAPRVVVTTLGAKGGLYRVDGGPPRAYPAAPLPGPIVDAYGCGDSFAAGLTFALGRGQPIEDALRVAASCGASALCRRGAYGAGAHVDESRRQEPVS